MNLRHLVLLGGCLLVPACKKESQVAATVSIPEPAKVPSVDLVDTHVIVALNRSALGLSLEQPIAREAGTINGVETSISGYVREVKEQFLVLSRHPRPREHDKDESLLWIPHTSILTIRQQYPEIKAEPEEAGHASSWRLEAVEGLMNLIGFNLRDLPQGELQVWIERGGKKDFLDSVDTHPGHEQWLYFGIEPFKREALMLTVMSEESRGSSRVFLPASEPKNFHKQNIPPDHDWTKSTLLATESPGTGNGKLYALLSPKGK